MVQLCPKSVTMANPNPARRRRLLLVVVLLAVVFAATAIALRSVWSRQGPPLWTADDLPPLPPTSDNGWPIAEATAAGIEPFDIGDPMQPVLDAMLADRGGAHRGATWEVLIAARPDLDAKLQTSTTRALLRQWRRATAAADYADACPLDRQDGCPSLGMQYLHQIVLVRALAYAVDEDWDSALREAAAAVRVCGRSLTSARGVAAAAIALEAAQQALVAADLLLWRHDPERDGAAQARAMVLAEVAALDPGPTPLRHALIGHYLRTESQLDSRASEQGSPLLYDPASTRADIGQAFTAAMDYVEGRAEHYMRPEVQCDYKWGLTTNTVGCMVVDDVLEDVATVASILGDRRPAFAFLAQLQASVLTHGHR